MSLAHEQILFVGQRPFWTNPGRSISSYEAMPGMAKYDTPETQPLLFRIMSPSISTNVSIGGPISCDAVAASQSLYQFGATWL